ncbi:MAG: ATP-dependent metallopeptidase FtsH/Yme1/Tma family protein, partial [Balneolaceae bacterium]|nr:ATP-dependent metallopeptidase FtsH/Yme1/Tma family protein [Balneolaceae bacterium]
MSDNKKTQKKRDSDSKNPIKGNNNSPKFPIWIYAVLLLALFGIQIFFMSQGTGNRIKYSQFLEYVEKGYVKEITIKNNSIITGEYSQKAVQEGIVSQNQDQDQWQLTDSEPSNLFNTTMIEGDEIRPLLDANEVVYDAKIEENWFDGIFVWLIVIGLAIAFWIFIFRRMNPGQQVLNIGKNKASLYDKQKENKVSFRDVAGLEEAKAEVEEVVEFL